MPNFKRCPICKNLALESFYSIDCTIVWCTNYKESAGKELQKYRKELNKPKLAPRSSCNSTEDHADMEDTNPQIYIPDWEEKLTKCPVCGKYGCNDSSCL